MSHLKKYIKDERLSAKEYARLAGKEPENARTFRSMAKDERKHAREMNRMEKHEMKEGEC